MPAQKMIISAFILMLSAPVALADGQGMHHITQKGDIYAPAMKSMHENMMITPTGDVDVDFVRGMIPHHQGAIDMAKIELAHGKDPAIRVMAKDIIAAQEKEIAQMRDWLQAHPAKH